MFENKKRNSFLPDVKISLRQRLFQPHMRVLDVFSGEGLLWDKAYQRTTNYIGIDVDDSLPTLGREIMHCDSMHALKQLDLNEFDLIDIDAFADPWPEFNYIVSTITRPSTTIFLTESLGRNVATSTSLAPFVSSKRDSAKGRGAFSHNRMGIYRRMLHTIVTDNGFHLEDLYIIRKKTFARVIYTGFNLVRN
jgi:hypothetical protein